ncbi:MAG: UDP-N-acetylmuramoyl-L-alanine--D-glutamate ligase [Deltaproteobacteria bacterium]|nr:MAG: UDP-N-acetylmuramoyl-L-alanine--D-glutamate ligase [Deltaproteobacteria bacterium]
MADRAGVKVLVAGAGISGRAAAAFCLAQKMQVTIADDTPLEALGEIVADLVKAGAEFVSPLERAGTDFDLCVLSPGISIGDERVKALVSAGVEVISELELAAREIATPIVAITGTNGKTTVTELTGAMLKASGRRVFVGGNVGTPLIEAAGGQFDSIVAEVSSFQLEGCSTFKPKVAVWLNLTGDHLDRHGNLIEYAKAKAKIFANQGAEEVAIVNRDDDAVWEASKVSGGTVLPYSTERILGVGAWLEGDDVVILMPGTDGVRLDARALALKGLHNLGNAMAATLAAASLGVKPKDAWGAVKTFKGLPHRLEEFLKWRGITFIDDSKATNVDAAVRAMDTVEGRIILLAGGKDKGADYSPMRAALTKRGVLAVIVGPSSERMAKELEGSAPIERASNWSEAVATGIGAAKAGDTVLLAPAASSFDFFKNYVERGEVFQQLCKEETKRMEVSA